LKTKNDTHRKRFSFAVMHQVERKQIKLNKNETNSPKTFPEIEIV